MMRSGALQRGLALVAAACAGTSGLGCTETATATALRALGSSGPVSFVCLGAPGDELATMARALDDCSGTRTETIDDYAVPHLYAMVTQPHTAQVAVVDLTTSSGAVLDADPAIPGADFLPVGALPSAIASTPGGAATFVATAEARYQGIYALPSDHIRGGAPRLSSWPSCRLPAAPEQLLLAVDPVDGQGASRPTCDAAYGATDDTAECQGTAHCHGDLAIDADATGSPGRYKLIVSLPSEGGVAVVDAQAILDQDAGAFEPCRIERWLPLQVMLPPAPDDPDPPSEGGACAEPPASNGPFAAAYQPVPAGMVFDGDRLYVADRGAPVIHRIDMLSPCEPVELPPLVTSSVEDPDRVVTTKRIAVSPLTLDLARYLYAIDDLDGSIMVYDVSDGSTSTRPFERADPGTNPFQPADRIRYQAPPRDVVLLQYQSDATDDQTGATLPVRCDPDPAATGPGAEYRTSSSYDSGASPFKLRGVFGFAVLASGDIVTIDVDDYDAPCRGPRDEDALLGCHGDPLGHDFERSDEYSCNSVAPHQTRAGSYLITKDEVAARQPGVADFPLLVDPDGALVQLDSPAGEAAPHMRATVPATASSARLLVAVGDVLVELDQGSGQLLDGDQINPNEHTLAMNLEDPRAHIIDQGWKATYEGALPGFDDRFAELSVDGDGYLLRELTSHFCARGVMSQTAIEEQLAAAGQSTSPAAGLADYVQIVSDTPIDGDAYWSQQSACGFKACQQTYGSSIQPRVARDLRIVEATPGTLELLARAGASAGAPPLECCFPYVVEFRVRAGEQWTVTGDEVGFLHHVTIDDRGVCRPTCAADEALLNGRVRQAPGGAVVADGEPLAFRNPMFRFAISGDTATRDMQFQFVTQGSFKPLTMNITTGDVAVLPANVTYLPPTGELVVSDGAIEGITLVDLGAFGITRQYR